MLANKYREGRVFIAGDAAHRRPPTTGLGLNTAIEDSYNLAWKLGLVLGGKAKAGLLDTYEIERRAIGRRNCDWGLFTFENSALINAAIGLIPGKKDANQLRFEALFEESQKGRSLRAQVARIIDSQSIEFSAHDIELGFGYEQGFLVKDGTESPESDPLGQNYSPSTSPGHRLPHAWLDKGDEVISTHDLAGRHSGFVLITDANGGAWVRVAKDVSQARGIKISAFQIDKTPYLGDYDDQWEQVKGIKPGGAVLVRPDNIVAWRSLYPSERNGVELRDAMNILFGDLTDETRLTNGSSLGGQFDMVEKA